MIRAVFFDFDGTLFDTKTANKLAYVDAIREAGFDIGDDDYDPYFGMRADIFLPKMIKGITSEQMTDIRARKAKIYEKNVDRIVPNEALLNFAKSVAPIMPVGIVTTASRRNVDGVLRHFDLADTFSFIVSGDDVANPKPDPEAYLAALKTVDAEPHEVVTFEDAKSGIEAARAAKLHVIEVKIP